MLENKTVVVLPGSFKPPHKGHWDMIMNYYNMPEVDSINIFISNISSNNSNVRLCNDGSFINPFTSKYIFDLYCNVYKVLDKVKIWEPKNPNSLISSIGFINNACQNCIIYLGCSTKNNDLKRWNEKTLNMFKKNPSNKIIIKPIIMNININASDIRKDIKNLKKEDFPDLLSLKQFNELKNLLNN